MNDFTKEELEILNDLINDCYQGVKFSSQSFESQFYPIRSKIQFMIDNYCDHDYIGSIKHCIDCGVSEFRCNKCGYVSYEGLE